MISMDNGILATALLSHSILNFPWQCFSRGKYEECRPRLQLLGPFGANIQLVVASTGGPELRWEFTVVYIHFLTTYSLDCLSDAVCLQRHPTRFGAFAVRVLYSRVGSHSARCYLLAWRHRHFVSKGILNTILLSWDTTAKNELCSRQSC